MYAPSVAGAERAVNNTWRAERSPNFIWNREYTCLLLITIIIIITRFQFED
jgi:hypothetical protein